MVELVGLCVYCGEPAVNTCSLCGALVCAKHYNATKGICTTCARGKKVSESK